MWEIVDLEDYDAFNIRQELQEFLRDEGLRQLDRCTLGVREAVVKSIYAKNLTDKQKENLELVKSGNAYVVTVSHQPHLLGGPVFVLYKALQAIALAETISEETGEPTVPIFWVHSDDHDWQELTTITIKNKEFSGFKERSDPFGFADVDDEVREYIRQVVSHFPNAKFMADFYRQGLRLADAFVDLMNFFLGDTGILFLDSGSSDVCKELIPFIKADLIEDRIYPIVAKTNEDWRSKGWKPIINPMRTNTFYIDNSGRRAKVIRKSDDSFIVGDAVMNKDELLAEIETHPEKFSPGVAVRILWQEHLLNSCAFTGGSTEILYWYQLIPLFREMGIKVPALFLRHSLFVVSEKIFPVVERLGGFKEFVVSWEELQAKAIKSVLPEWFPEGELVNKCRELENLVDSVKRADVRSFLAGRLRKLAKQWNKEVRKARKMLIGPELERIKRVHEQLMPLGKWQERTISLLEFVDRYGTEGVRALITAYPRNKESKVAFIKRKGE
ncbi:MAG: bacillithiol biosynthesis BshC [Chlorobi bacterium]|nr:bacillithiol biosynthesis BshC [Chlorobiota bacterium]